LFGGTLRSFVILGRSDAKRCVDPRIHAVTSARDATGENGALSNLTEKVGLHRSIVSMSRHGF